MSVSSRRSSLSSCLRFVETADNGRKVISSGFSSSRNIGLQAAKLKTRFRPHTCNNSTVRIGSYESILSSPLEILAF